MDKQAEQAFLVEAPSRMEVELWVNATSAGPYAIYSVGGVAVGIGLTFVDAAGHETSKTFAFDPTAGVADSSRAVRPMQEATMQLTTGNGTVSLYGNGSNVHTDVVLRVYPT